MDLVAVKEAFRAHVQTAAGCPVRWGSKADFAPPDGAASPLAVAYLRITSHQILGDYNEDRWEGAKLRRYEHVLTKSMVTVMFEAADGRDNFDAFFYASKAESVLRRRDVSYPANLERFDVRPTGTREGPTLQDDGETLTTAVLEVVWTCEYITSSAETNRLTGTGLSDEYAIETMGEPGKIEDVKPEGAAITFGGSCVLTP